MQFEGPTRDITFVSESFVQQALRLADDAFMLLGCRHWIWQLGLLFAVDLDITLLKYSGSRWEMEKSYTSDMATLLANLLELWDWLSSVKLSADPACWLYTRAEKLLSLVRMSDDEALERNREALQKRLRSAGVVVDTLGSRVFLPQAMSASLAC
eukprot:UN3730